MNAPLPWPKNTADGAAVPSPCISVCKMTAAGRNEPSVCEGCGRTLDEIAAWSVMTDADKVAVWAALPDRMKAFEPPG